MTAGRHWRPARATRRAISIGALCAPVLPALAPAQAAPVRVPRETVSRAAPGAMPAGPGATERETSAILVADAAPRSFRVVTVAIPAALRRAERVRYDVERIGGATILGSETGSLDPRSPSSSVVLTLGVPAGALGGRARVAMVRFTADGRVALDVPIELDVAGRSRIDVTPRRAMRGAQRGDRIDMSFSIRNAGNVRDTIDLVVAAPPAWSTRFTEPSHIALAPGEMVERTIVVLVPTLCDLGDFGVAIVATGRGGERARGLATVEVTDRLQAGFRSGPVVTLGVGSTANVRGETRAVESAAVQGRVSDGVTISGRISSPLPSDPVTSRSLAMLDYSPRSNFLSVGAATWSATLGNTGTGLSALGGESVFGRGGSLRFDARNSEVRLFAAAPDAGGGASWDQSSLIGASIDTKVGAGTVSAFLAHLRDSSYSIRALDAAGVGLDVRPWSDGMVSGELAARSYRGGSGMGVAGVLHTPLAGGQVDLRLAHAPGGANAFALATDELTATGDRAIGRLRADASYWTTRDESVSSDVLNSTGWSLSPAYPVLPTLTMTSYVQGSSITTSGSDGSFASTQRDLGVRGVLLRGGFELSADGRLSTISRAIGGASPAAASDVSRRITDRLRLDHAGARGEFGIGGSVETNIVGAATLPAQTTIDAHIDRLQPITRLPHLTLSGSAQRLRFGDATLTMSRLEANLELARSTRIVFGIERGTARDAAGVLQTVLTLKVERAARLPALGRRSATGVVFEDRNGNGVRDPGEPGVSGIVVRRGAQSAVTDGGGVFRLDDRAAGRTEIDPRSLPSGWLPSSRSMASEGAELSLGVVPSAALDVDVTLAVAGDAAAPVTVGRAVLTLRDSAGRVWTAWTDGASHATFDALPVGRYTLVTTLDGPSEPLLVDPVAPIEITGAARRQHVAVTVRTRPLRMFKAQP